MPVSAGRGRDFTRKWSLSSSCTAPKVIARFIAIFSLSEKGYRAYLHPFFIPLTDSSVWNSIETTATKPQDEDLTNQVFELKTYVRTISASIVLPIETFFFNFKNILLNDSRVNESRIV